VIIHDPYDDPPGFEARADSPEPTEEILASSRIGADENINDYAGKSEVEINEMLASKVELQFFGSIVGSVNIFKCGIKSNNSNEILATVCIECDNS
jgi:hypothetical protein